MSGISESLRLIAEELKRNRLAVERQNRLIKRLIKERDTN
jgi:hypothetical protein